MFEHYLITALWSSMDDEGDSLGEVYTLDDFSESEKDIARRDCELFCEKAGILLEGLDIEQVGHDFWLTRNGHGAGFWDGDYEKELGDKLTAIAEEFPEINIYVGDDNKLYFAQE